MKACRCSKISLKVFPLLKLLVILLILNGNLSPALAQEKIAVEANANPQLASAATTASTERLAALTQYIEQARQDWEVPGLAVAIVKDDQLVLCQGFGVREIGRSEPVDAQTLFAIASNSKAFTAAALAILVDEGKLSWDDPVSEFLPWLHLKDPMTRDLRIRDLLCHRSGLGTYSGDLLWWGTKYSPREVLERAVELEPAAPFRAKYGYSNLMFLAAGLVVEKISGQSWNQFVQQRILKPLGMPRTVTSVSDLEKLGNCATPHKTLLTESKPIAWMNWDNMAAAGGIVSSVEDMSQWMRLQLRRGKLAGPESTELFSEKQSSTMWQVQTPIPVSESYRRSIPSANYRGYGLGWSLSDYLGRKVVSHGGGYDGMYSQVLLVPSENLGVVVLTNSMTGISPAITYRVMDSYFGNVSRDWSQEKLQGFRSSRKQFHRRIKTATTPVENGSKSSHLLFDYVGTYRCPMYGDATVTQEGEGLVLRLLPAHELVADLEHLHFDTYKIRWRKEFAWFGAGTANFIANSRGEFTRLELDVPNDDMWFYELKFAKAKQ